MIPNHIHHIYGYIQVYAWLNDKQTILEIPFDETILHGTINYKKEDTYFYISFSNNESINTIPKQCQPIKIFNEYNIPVFVYNITVNNVDQLSKYVKVKN